MPAELRYKGYRASVRYSAEDDLLVGKVLGIQDSVNFHAASIPELHQVFQDCIDNYMDALAEDQMEEQKRM